MPRVLLAGAVVLFAHRLAAGCEAHNIYTATQVMQGLPGPYVGIGEQFSAGRTVRNGDTTIPARGERLDTSITTTAFGWNFTPNIGAQVTLPIIARNFRRREKGTLVRDDETGPGDLTLLARWTPFSFIDQRWSFRFSLLGGLELPTGDTARLAEERVVNPVGTARHRRGPIGPTHGPDDDGHGAASAVHAHDLALGSGSVDGIIGAQLYYAWRRVFVATSGQYALRTTGSHDYRFANALAWSAQAGWFLLAQPDRSVAIAAAFSGETKGKDRQDGAQLDDTGLTTVYAGPGALVTWGQHFGGEIAVDLPILQHTTAPQIVPDVRVRGGLTWRF